MKEVFLTTTSQCSANDTKADGVSDFAPNFCHVTKEIGMFLWLSIHNLWFLLQSFENYCTNKRKHSVHNISYACAKIQFVTCTFMLQEIWLCAFCSPLAVCSYGLSTCRYATTLVALNLTCVTQIITYISQCKPGFNIEQINSKILSE